MQIRQVETKADLRWFIEAPYRLYHHDPMWAPPLRSEQWSQFDARRNPMLDHCEYSLFLLLDGGQVIGRISAFVDHLAVQAWGEPIGLFGSYECVDDDQVQEGYTIPQRYLTLTDRVQKRYGITVRPVNLHRLEHEVAAIVELANRSIAHNWGFYPVTEAEGKALARDLKQIVDPAAILIAEGPDGQAIGFAMALPDVNVLLRGLDGRLLPFGWLKLLWGLPRLRQYRMWALGVAPEYQGKAVDSLLYRHVYEALYPRRVRIEINYVLEDNAPMNNALRRLGVKDLRRYRVYEMTNLILSHTGQSARDSSGR